MGWSKPNDKLTDAEKRSLDFFVRKTVPTPKVVKVRPPKTPRPVVVRLSSAEIERQAKMNMEIMKANQDKWRENNIEANRRPE